MCVRLCIIIKMKYYEYRYHFGISICDTLLMRHRRGRQNNTIYYAFVRQFRVNRINDCVQYSDYYYSTYKLRHRGFARNIKYMEIVRFRNYTQFLPPSSANDYFTNGGVVYELGWGGSFTQPPDQSYVSLRFSE